MKKRREVDIKLAISSFIFSVVLVTIFGESIADINLAFDGIDTFEYVLIFIVTWFALYSVITNVKRR